MNDGVEISNQDRKRRGRSAPGCQTAKKGLPVPQLGTTGARGSVNVNEGMATMADLQQVTRPALRDGDRNVGQDCNCPFRCSSRGREVAGVAPGGGQGEKLGRRGHLLEENQVGRGVVEEGWQASHGHLLGQVEGEKGKEGRPTQASLRAKRLHLKRKEKTGKGRGQGQVR